MDQNCPAKKLVVLHIGTDKTGSTAIQKLFAANPEPLGRYGWLYLQEGRGTVHCHALLYEQALGGNLAAWARLRDELLASSMPNGLVSFEGLYHLDEGHLLGVAEALTGLAVRVVIYLRRQSDMVRSGVAQLFKQGTMKFPLALYKEDEPRGHRHRLRAHPRPVRRRLRSL